MSEMNCTCALRSGCRYSPRVLAISVFEAANGARARKLILPKLRSRVFPLSLTISYKCINNVKHELSFIQLQRDGAAAYCKLNEMYIQW